jgi:cysteinyl-tRNA synthetase
MALRIYNTLTRRKDELEPRHPGEVRMYVCGPNLYGPSHVGHAMSYLVFDVIHRYLEYRRFRVIHVQNFTDIEDRIIETARDEGTTIEALAARYIDRFLHEMEGLGVRRADHYPRATQAIPKIIEMIRVLMDRGLAYARDGDVFFRVAAFPEYGRLSGRSLDEMQAGARIEVDPRKEHPMDFVLWKSAKPDEPSWDSPWGRGRPGWHIECSAMSIALLGDQLDIHGGGQDVMFPHHENEIAQSEGFTGKRPFVRYWVHNGLLRLSEGEEKMTRHLGNIITIREALERYHSDTIRVFVLSSHYRAPTTWNDEALGAAARGAERLRTALANADELAVQPVGMPTGAASRRGRPQRAPETSAEPPPHGDADLPRTAETAREAFEASMDDDFNTPGALAALFDLASVLNRVTDGVARGHEPLDTARRESLRHGSEVLRELGSVLGLRLVSAPTPAQVAGLQRLAQELAQERPDLFDPAGLARVGGPSSSHTHGPGRPGTHPQERLGAGAPTDGPQETDATLAEVLIRYIAEGRMQARRQKDWATGDRIRARLQDLGVLLEDTPSGYKWRIR